MADTNEINPSDSLLPDYVLNLLSPEERDEVEARLTSHREEADRVERLRQTLAALESERESDIEPPPGLAAAAIAHTAHYLIDHKLLWAVCDPLETLKPGSGLKKGKVPSYRDHLPPEPAPAPEAHAVPVDGAASSPKAVPNDPFFPVWLRRPDTVIATFIVLLAVGIGVTGIAKVRAESQVRNCQSQLRELSQALEGYSQVQNGRYPKVGTPDLPVTGALVSELVRAGQISTDHSPKCPLASSDSPAFGFEPIQYSYALGYLNPAGNLMGLRHDPNSTDSEDWSPIAADLVKTPRSPLHPGGQNVLYVGGMVRFTTTASVGLNGDDIYLNEVGLTRAGLHRGDTCLGQLDDHP